MLEAKLTIEAPGLTQALNRLADALAYHDAEPSANTAASVPAQTPTAPPVPTAPVPAVPVAAVPVAAAPCFTAEQVGKAGADLIAADPSKMPSLIALLGQYGVRSIVELPQDQLGAFATALRGLGAKL